MAEADPQSLVVMGRRTGVDRRRATRDEAGAMSLQLHQHLWRALETANTVQHRGEFFLWAQGQLQALIPHGLLACLMLDAERRLVHVESLQSVVLHQRVLDALTTADGGLLARLERLCHARGSWSLLLGEVDANDASDPALEPLLSEWRALEIGDGLAQGSGPLGDGGSTFFVLTGLPSATDAAQRSQQRTMLRLLLPQLHLALLRTRSFSARAASGSLASAQSLDLSERQVEILHWVKLGKTNHEIAAILAISELTVKNHMQKIFKKLDVHNRAQAVARLMAMQLD